jgi:hypothetical protein
VKCELRSEDRIYTASELEDILERAEALGFQMNSPVIARMTLRELEVLVTQKQ